MGPKHFGKRGRVVEEEYRTRLPCQPVPTPLRRVFANRGRRRYPDSFRDQKGYLPYGEAV